MIVVAMFVLTGCGKTTVNLNQYITIVCGGYDSLGTASFTFDYEAFEKDYSGKIKLNSKNNDEMKLLSLLSEGSSAELLLDMCVSQSLDRTGNLSNGDTVTITVSISGSVDTFVENYGVVISETKRTYTVENMPQSLEAEQGNGTSKRL